MPRRYGNVQTLSAISGSVAVGTHNFVTGQSGIVLSLQSFVLTGAGAATTCSLRAGNGGTLLFTGNADANSSTSTEFGDGKGLELPVNSGVYVTVGTAVANLNLYYNVVDERTPITKYAARLDTLALGPATATRTPNMFGGQSQT